MINSKKNNCRKTKSYRLSWADTRYLWFHSPLGWAVWELHVSPDGRRERSHHRIPPVSALPPLPNPHKLGLDPCYIAVINNTCWLAVLFMWSVMSHSYEFPNTAKALGNPDTEALLKRIKLFLCHQAFRGLWKKNLRAQWFSSLQNKRNTCFLIQRLKNKTKQKTIKPVTKIIPFKSTRIENFEYILFLF